MHSEYVGTETHTHTYKYISAYAHKYMYKYREMHICKFMKNINTLSLEDILERLLDRIRTAQKYECRWLREQYIPF